MQEMHSVFERVRKANVVRLPTAAPRKVKQPGMSRKYWRAVEELPRHPAEHLNWRERRALADAQAIADFDEHALRLLVAVLINRLPKSDRIQAQMQLCLHADKAHGMSALAFFRLQTGDIGDQGLLNWALKRLARELA